MSDTFHVFLVWIVNLYYHTNVSFNQSKHVLALHALQIDARVSNNIHYMHVGTCT